jgi:hypothetical protein
MRKLLSPLADFAEPAHDEERRLQRARGQLRAVVATPPTSTLALLLCSGTPSTPPLRSAVQRRIFNTNMHLRPSERSILVEHYSPPLPICEPPRIARPPPSRAGAAELVKSVHSNVWLFDVNIGQRVLVDNWTPFGAVAEGRGRLWGAHEKVASELGHGADGNASTGWGNGSKGEWRHHRFRWREKEHGKASPGG